MMSPMSTDGINLYVDNSKYIDFFGFLSIQNDTINKILSK